jgi:hypothetical protein
MSNLGERTLARPVSFRHHPTLWRLERLQKCLWVLGSDLDIHKQFHMQKVLSMGRYAPGDVGSVLLAGR